MRKTRTCALAIKSQVTITTARPIEEREAVYKGVSRCWGDRTNVLRQVLNWPRSLCCPGDLELRRAEPHSPGDSRLDLTAPDRITLFSFFSENSSCVCVIGCYFPVTRVKTGELIRVLLFGADTTNVLSFQKCVYTKINESAAYIKCVLGY